MPGKRFRRRSREVDTPDAETQDTAARAQNRDRQQSTDQANSDYVTHESGPDRNALSERHGLDIGRREAQQLKQLEAEFGTEQVHRWAAEGMPVEAMGKPRDMQAFRERTEDQSVSNQSGSTTASTLEVSSPDDPAEKEAEAVAAQVVSDDASDTADGQRSQSSAGVQAAATAGGSAGSGAVSERTASTVKQGVQGGGKPLGAETRRTFESKLNAGFSGVRVHTDSTADEAARSINAEAYTMGSDIAFASGAYNPDSRSGQQLLAHELTHVVQQGQADSADRSAPVRRTTGVQVQRGLFSDAVSSVKNAAEDAKETAESAAESAKETAESAAESAKETAESAVESAKEAGQSAAESAKETAESAAETATQAGKSALGAAKDAGESVLGAAKQAGKSALDSATEIGKTLLGKAQKAGQSLLGNAKQAVDAIAAEAHNLGEQAWDIVESAGQKAWNTLKRNGAALVRMVEHGGQRAWDALKRNADALVRMLQNGGQRAWNILKHRGQQVWNVLKNAGSRVWSVLERGGQRLWNVLRSNTQLLVNMLKRGGQRIWQILQRGGRQAWSVLRNAGQQVWSVLRSNTQRLLTLLERNTRLLVAMLRNSGQRIWQILKGAGRRLWGLLRRGGRQVWNALQTVASPFWTFLRQSVTRVWQAIRHGGRWLWQVLQTVRQQVLGFLRSVPQRLLTLVRTLRQAGVPIPPWLWQGIKRLLTNPAALGQWLLNGLRNAASQAITFVKRMLTMVGLGPMRDVLNLLTKIDIRPLTSEEAREGDRALHGAVDYDRVRIDERSLIATLGREIQDAQRMAVTTMHIINFTEPINPSAGSGEMAWLVHELTHVAQYEAVGTRYLPEAVHAQTMGAGYDYSYNDLQNESFGFFNREQQASIVGDYYAKVLYNASHNTDITDQPSDFFSAYNKKYQGTYEPHIAAVRSGRM